MSKLKFYADERKMIWNLQIVIKKLQSLIFFNAKQPEEMSKKSTFFFRKESVISTIYLYKSAYIKVIEEAEKKR